MVSTSDDIKFFQFRIKSDSEWRFEYTRNIFSSPVGSLCHTPGIVCRPSSVVHHVSSVSTITTRNNVRYQIHIWCKCLSCSWIAPPRYWWHPPSVIKLWLKNHIFTFSLSYAIRLPKPRPL